MMLHNLIIIIIIVTTHIFSQIPLGRYVSLGFVLLGTLEALSHSPGNWT